MFASRFRSGFRRSYRSGRVAEIVAVFATVFVAFGRGCGDVAATGCAAGAATAGCASTAGDRSARLVSEGPIATPSAMAATKPAVRASALPTFMDDLPYG